MEEPRSANWNIAYSTIASGVFAELSKASKSKIFALDYRLGPQYTFISIIGDVVAAYFYLTTSKQECGLGIPSSKIVVGGDSAGGGLPANLVHILKNFGTNQVGGIFLWSPSIDLTFSQHSRIENGYCDLLLNITSPSIVVGGGLVLDSNEFLFITQGLYQLPEITPPFDPNMKDFPPTLIITSERGAFRNSPIIYGKRRAETEKLSGTKPKIPPNIQTMTYQDMPHVFMTIPGGSRCNSAIQ